jgi:hypothetical protein
VAVHPQRAKRVEGSVLVGVLALLLACSPKPPPPKDPPTVTVTVTDSVIAGPVLKVRVNIVGCEAVSDLGLYHQTARVRSAVFAGNPTEVTMQPSDFNQYYNPLGIAVPLTLTARATCDDGRTNASVPVGVRFFPVASVLEGAGGAQTLPDSFVAEGGVGTTPVTFVGCIGTANGTALARVNLAGEVIGANLTLPFPCSYSSQISEKNSATRHRWLIEPLRGVFSFDDNLNINAVAVNAGITVMGVAPNGDAIIWDSKAPQTDDALFRITPTGGAFPAANRVWAAQTTGIVNASPVVDGLGTVYVSSWVGSLGSLQGSIVVQRFNFATGALINPTYNLASFEFGDFDSPEIPNGAFNASGSVLYFPYQTGSRAQSRVLACATTQPDCQGAAQKWISPTLDGVALFALPYSRDTLVAVIAAQKTWFLNEANGQVVNFEGKPVEAKGILYAHAVQPGAANDFFILNGPAGGYPTEIVAIDAPDRGELWRYELSSGGELPTSALYLALDESGQAWIRSGARQIKPFSLTQYRDTKGANPPTP